MGGVTCSCMKWTGKPNNPTFFFNDTVFIVSNSNDVKIPYKLSFDNEPENLSNTEYR